MASFAVTITTSLTPAIVVTVAGTTTYAEFKQSLGSIVYGVEKSYVYSPQNYQQINGGFGYSKYDSDGRQSLQSIISSVDPYQYQPAKIINLEGRGIILDGRDWIRFNMLPNSEVVIKFLAEKISVSDTMPGDDNFQFLEENLIDYDFFKQYTELI